MGVRRVEQILGQSMEALSAEQIVAAVEARDAAQLSEDLDLDFKAGHYPKTDAGRRELAKDVSAMANTQGGVIILGVHESDGVADALAPVSVARADRQVQWFHSSVAAAVFPSPLLRVFPKILAGSGGAGFYILEVPRSRGRPHAVLANAPDRALCYWRRIGRDSRLMNEAEVADTYRSRFEEARGQIDRLAEIFREGSAALPHPPEIPNPPEPGLWLVMALTPQSGGDFVLTRDTVEGTASWFDSVVRSSMVPTTFATEFSRAAPRVRRVAVVSARDERSRMPTDFCGQFHTDGSGFIAKALYERVGSEIMLDETAAVALAQAELSLLVGHATRTGAAGDAVVIFTPLIGSMPLRLQSKRFPSFEVANVAIDRPLMEGRTINLEDCGSAPGLVRATRLVITDLFHASGLAEVRGISSDGALQMGRFSQTAEARLRPWAAERGVAIE